jgi:excisionase family DNA binding protein
VDTGDRLLTPGEVAALFRVDPKTVTRWAAAGRIGSIRTPGGHRRFRESEVRALLEGELGELDEEEAGGPARPPENPPNNRAGGPAGQSPPNPSPPNPSGPAGQSPPNPSGPAGQSPPNHSGPAATPGTTQAGAHVSARPRGTPGIH